MNTAKALPAVGSRMELTGLWNEDKVFAGEGSVLTVMDSAFYPVLTSEKWIMHNNMWTFVPQAGEGLL